MTHVFLTALAGRTFSTRGLRKHKYLRHREPMRVDVGSRKVVRL